MKDYLFFGLFDVLVKHNFEKEINIDYLKELSVFAKENNKELFLLTGLKEAVGKEIVTKHNLTNYFKEENIIYISTNYENSLGELDKKLKEQKYLDNPLYCDDYYKVYYFNNECKIQDKSKILFVGHDLWTDGYYLRKYSQIDFILNKNILTRNHKTFENKIENLHIVDIDFNTLKKYLTTNNTFDYTMLDAYSKTILHNSIMGQNLNVFNNEKIRDFIVKQAKKNLKKNEGEE